MQHAGHHDVVYVAPVAGDEPGIFAALDALADEPVARHRRGGDRRRHGCPAAAASRTAAMMP